MATIPMGNFGQAQARPGPLASIPQGGPAALGTALDRMGQIGGAIAGDMERQRLTGIHDQQQEAQRLQREQDREAKIARTEAERAQTLVAMNGTKDKLADLHDHVSQGVLDGTVPKEKAESTFTTQATKLLGAVGADLPEQHRAVGIAELTGTADRLGNSVRKAVTQRDRQDVTSGINQTLEYLRRQYATDPGKSTQQAIDTVDKLGPFSTMSPDQLGKLKQGWKEDTQFTAGYELVSAGRNDRKKLEAAVPAIAAMPDLDTQKRAVLLDRVQSYGMVLDQKAEMAAARAQRESERRLAMAEAEFKTFQAMADKGTAMDPAYIDRAVTATTGTPYQAGVVALAKQAREAGGLAAQPVAAQRAALDQVNSIIATRGRSPELDKRKEQIEKVLRGSEADLEKDGLRAGLERGVITSLPPIDPSRGIPGIVQQLQTRAVQAASVKQWAGRAVSPLNSDEAVAVGKILSSLPADQFGAAAAMLAGALPSDQMQALASQLDAHDKPLSLALAAGADKTTIGRTTAELIRKGGQVMAEKRIKLDSKGDQTMTQTRTDIYKAIGDSMSGPSRENVADAAMLINFGFDSSDPARAVRLAVGGDIVKHNGHDLPVSAGITVDVLRDRLAAMPRTDIERQAPDGWVYSNAGRPQGVPEFLAGLPSARLEPAGRGRYYVRSGSGVALSSTGKPIVLEMR